MPPNPMIRPPFSPLRRPLLLAATCLVSSGATAFAVDPTQAIFAVADVDASASLSQAEFTTTLASGVSAKVAKSTFKKADLNSDGELRYFEFQVYRGDVARPGKIELEFRLADYSGDGLLSFEEFISTGPSKWPWIESLKRFLIADANQNQTLTLTEYTAYRNGQATPPSGVSLLKFDLADLNDDGHLEIEEFAWTVPPASSIAKLEAKFNKLDKNDDGVITRNEWNPGVPKQQH